MPPWAQQKFAKVLLDPARAGAEGIVDQLAALGAAGGLCVVQPCDTGT